MADINAAILALDPDQIWIIPEYFHFHSTAWDEDTLGTLLQGYSNLAAGILSGILDGTYKGVRLDPFTPFIYLFCTRQKKRLSCGGAGSMIAVTPAGQLYPCCALV